MTAPPGLHSLARLHNVQTAYHDTEGRRVQASPEALLAALRALGVELPDAAAIPSHLQHRRRSLWERVLDPVVVVWTPSARGLDGVEAGTAKLRTPERLRDLPVRVTVGLESGARREASPEPASLLLLRSEEVDGVAYIERALPLPSVPTGYHDLVVEVGTGRARRRHEALLIAAPDRAAGWADLPGSHDRDRPPWGLFVPLYALHERTEPRPSYPLLARLAGATAEAGGSVIGTLPLLAAFLDHPYEPSPYSPVSRLFWNGLYVEPRAPVGHDGGVEEDPGRYLDARGLMQRRRPALEAEARQFFGDGDGEDPPELAAFLARNPRAEDYARFRALTESLGAWPSWPDRLRARDVRPGDYDDEVARYHLYLQWRAERQLAEAAERAESRGVSLYLDLPMGVHPDGYDVWRERALFATRASAGAPPDALAPEGQDWGFPPMHPEASRFQRHQYFIASIRTHLRFARVLRIDHIMQLHRLYWVPAGDSSDGLYVRYPAEELYAILCLESRRAGTVIVGEDLGTVPRVVRREMRRRGLPGMYVLQFELTEPEEPEEREDPAAAAGELVPRPARAGDLASIGTHDTPTFAGWWWGEDIRIRRELGHLTEEEAEAQLEGRRVMREKLARGLEVERPSTGGREAEQALAVEAELLRRLGESGAGLVLATLEDLWLEPEPQNVPGTTGERNWRRRTQRPLEALAEPAVATLLDVLNEARGRATE